MQGLKSAILAMFQSGLGWSCFLSTGHQESLIGIKNIFLFWVPMIYFIVIIK